MIPLRDANPTYRTPVVTIGLIVACFLGWAYELYLLASAGSASLDAFLADWGIVPDELVSALSSGNALSLETATLLTYQFLHGGWLHILGNVLFLWIFGNNIEDRLGRVGFLLFYLSAGVVAGLTQVLIDPTSSIPTIGASGAIAGTLGAYLVLFPRARITSLVFLGFFYQLIDVPAIIVLLFWIALQVIDGIASIGLTEAGGVAFFAHIGGFAFGAAVALLLTRVLRRPAGMG